jgi:hypothetical protein
MSAADGCGGSSETIARMQIVVGRIPERVFVENSK